MSTMLPPLSVPFSVLRSRSTPPASALDPSHNRGSTASSATFASDSTMVGSSTGNMVGDDLLTPPTSPYDVVHSPLKHPEEDTGAHAVSHILLKGHAQQHEGKAGQGLDAVAKPKRTGFSRATSWTIALAGLAKRGRQRRGEQAEQDPRVDSGRSPTPSGKPSRFGLLRRSDPDTSAHATVNAPENTAGKSKPARPIFRRARSTTYARQFDQNYSLAAATSGKLAQPRGSLFPPHAVVLPEPQSGESEYASPVPLTKAHMEESLQALHEYSETYKPRHSLDAGRGTAPEEAVQPVRPELRRDKPHVGRPDRPDKVAVSLEEAWRDQSYRGHRGRAICAISQAACTIYLFGLRESIATCLYIRGESTLCILGETMTRSAGLDGSTTSRITDFSEMVDLPSVADVEKMKAKWNEKGCLTVTVPLKSPPKASRSANPAASPSEQEGGQSPQPRQCATSTGFSRRLADYRMEDVECVEDVS